MQRCVRFVQGGQQFTTVRIERQSFAHSLILGLPFGQLGPCPALRCPSGVSGDKCGEAGSLLWCTSIVLTLVCVQTARSLPVKHGPNHPTRA